MALSPKLQGSPAQAQAALEDSALLQVIMWMFITGS